MARSGRAVRPERAASNTTSGESGPPYWASARQSRLTRVLSKVPCVVGAVARPAITLRASGATRRGGSREGSPNSLGIPCASLSADDDDNERMRFAHTGLLHCRRQNRASARRRGTPHFYHQQGLEAVVRASMRIRRLAGGRHPAPGRPPRGCWRKGSRALVPSTAAAAARISARDCGGQTQPRSGRCARAHSYLTGGSARRARKRGKCETWAGAR